MTDKMTPTRAIAQIKDFEAYFAREVCEDLNKEDREALDMAIESLEKQIPKKPNTKFYEQGGVISKCPVCGDWDGDWWFNEPKYCRGCGQAIDWSDTE